MRSKKQRHQGNGADVRAKLQAQGLLDIEGRVTPQGESWTKRVMQEYRKAHREEREKVDA